MKQSFLRPSLFFVTLLFLLYGCKAPVTVPSYSDGNVMVAAHRAFHQTVPENSLAAIRESIKAGIDIAEIDVRRTADDSLVLLHDGTIDRTTTGSGEIETLYWNEVKDLFLLHDGEVTAEKIPLFRNALLLGKGKILFDLDLKTEKIEKIMEVVVQTDASKSVFFFDSDWPVLEKVRQKHPGWYLMPRAYNVEMAKEAYDKFKPWAIHVDPSFASAELSEYFHSRGVYVWINALGAVDRSLKEGDTRPFQDLIATNPSIIQTDLPIRIKQLVRKSSAGNKRR